MSSLILVWHVKCMSYQLSRFIQPSVTKHVLMDGWHVLKNTCYESLHMTKSQLNLAHVANKTKNQPSLI
jgi:hypothetical protein